MSFFLRRHGFLLLLLAAGAALRVVTWLAYRPALLYIDSFRYLDNLHALRADQLNPIGYDLVLRPLLALGGLAFVAAVQHLAGLAIAVGVYALALKLGARRWAGALAAAPVLLDAYQLQIEQTIMSEVVFEALLLGLLWLLLARRGAPGWKRVAAAGLLVGATVLVRFIGVAVAVPFLGYVLVAGGAWRHWKGWLRAGIGVLGMVVVLLPNVLVLHAETGNWALAGPSGSMLYGRAAAVADCATLDLQPELRVFCPVEPVEQRLVDNYTHADLDPNWPGPLPPGADRQKLAHEFAVAVLKAQPWDVPKAILGDFAKSFAFARQQSPTDVALDRWQFQPTYPLWADTGIVDQLTVQYDGVTPKVNPPLASFLRGYQLGGGYVPGAVLGFGALLGLLTVFRRRKPRDRARTGALFASASGLILLFASAVFEFSWRYQLPALVLLPLAGALGFTTLTAASRRRLAAYPDAVDVEAVREFDERYPGASLAPLTVVIAAYNEAGGIGQVLAEMPGECVGLPVHVLVVVDGGTDDTAEIAVAHGAYVCVAPRNRGQGAALRLGYHLAAGAGAEYLVTTDADGQYDNSELAGLVAPLLDGTADFVTGSRRLGQEEADSRVRWLGVRVFAALASVLTWRRITDTSFGFRAMRAELACAVPLGEPQYQSSELMLGMTAHGARVLELPMSMRLRKAGKSKKGGSLVYGANYARVMTGTWWRGYVLRRGRTRAGRAG
ncbi:glycosyltransferase family 2 protein [Amycolatopsis sp. H20-H5]|uniref:glycosyltransferase family 2 protein n=1 Tax=Amycolatopsis sp. H20-H5 TaxID=3046309 RepID=UPI002DB6F3DD|nr:glycosyltransferase family 2 protein [Amycolatopsis sp. H20-H5]MEC3976421.1 glycosyltransferase family 2 protein [Amycolatopsis sp. H20-H5]